MGQLPLDDLICTKCLSLVLLNCNANIQSESGYVVIIGQSQCYVDSLSLILIGLSFTTAKFKASILYILEALGQDDGCVVLCHHYEMPGGKEVTSKFPFGLVFSFPLSLYIGCHCACVTDLGYTIIKW